MQRPGKEENGMDHTMGILMIGAACLLVLLVAAMRSKTQTFLNFILSFIYFGTLYGIREGTIIHAILVGRAVKWSDRLFGRKLDDFIWRTPVEIDAAEELAD